MDAIISGRAGVAFLVEGDVLSSFDVEDPATLLPRSPADLRLIFGEAPDIQLLEDVNHAEAAQHLERAFNCASALDLALILFDPELTDELRDDAAEELERLLSEPTVVEYLENILYGRPLPAATDIAGALARCEGGRLPKLSATLQIIEGYQPAIRAVCAAWDSLPANLFGGGEQKAEFQHVAVREGLFRHLAFEAARGPHARVSDFILRSSLKHSITSLRNYREVLQQWIRPFRAHADAPRVRHEVEEFLEESSLKHRGRHGRSRRRNAEEELGKLQGQLDLIVAAMHRRDLAFARKITDEVIDYQLKTAKPIHAAKTLCNLAAEAKALGIYPLQLELTERAIQIAPDDDWSWAQYADALLKLQRPIEALKAYEQAESFGAGVFAKTGRAETLRALGRLPEALDAYDAAVAQHPENVVAKNGRAETLRAMNRLAEALDAYDDAVAQHPEDVVARRGRAETLKALGRLDDALAAYDAVLAENIGDVIAKNGRAETLRAMNRLAEALDAYDDAVAQHPEDVVAKTGRAESLRALGRLPEALAAYGSIVAQHPEDAFARNGRIGILVALRRYDEALGLLSVDNPVTLQDWIGYHIRGMILLRTKKIEEAIQIFERGVRENPIPASKEYFRGALAVAYLRKKDYQRAESMLESVNAPLLQPQANVLRLHASGAWGKTDRANAAYEKLRDKPWFISDELVAELHRRYILKEEPRHDDEWVFEREADTRLFDPNQQALSFALLAA